MEALFRSSGSFAEKRLTGLIMTELYLNILDKKRKEILPILKKFKDRFYLAGGTGLALQLGHRDSIDFDYFTDKDFNSEDLLREVKELFGDYTVELVQAGNKTLNIVVEGSIKISFFCIRERRLKPLLDSDYFYIADLDDIACMKITALLRAEFKDYVDLYYIFKQKTLKEVLDNCKMKYDGFDEIVYLKALVSFEDIHFTEMLFERGKQIKLKEIKKDFDKKVKEYLDYKIKEK